MGGTSRRRWCRGRSLGAPDEWKSRAERLQTLRSSAPSQLGFPPRRVRARACRTDRAPPAWPSFSQLWRRCCLREETGGLEKPDDGGVVATGGAKGAAAGTHIAPGKAADAGRDLDNETRVDRSSQHSADLRPLRLVLHAQHSTHNVDVLCVPASVDAKTYPVRRRSLTVPARSIGTR